MSALSPLWIPAFLGYFTLALLLRGVPLRWKQLFLLAASIPTGFGICSLILFFSLWVIPSQACALSWSSSLGAVLLLGSTFLRQSAKDAPLERTSGASFNFEIFRQKFIAYVPKDGRTTLRFIILAASFMIFLITLWGVIHFFLLTAATNITGGWDARYMWSLKAKFMFRSPEAWQGMFSPLLSWSHTDYPLLWPGTLAWGWNWLGQESLLWPPWASLCFYVACVLILVWYLGTQVSPLAGWWGGTFFLTLIPPLFWSIHLYTDLPLAFFMAGSVLTLLVGLRSGQKNILLVSGLMAGLAAWTKNEGLQFLVVTGLLLGGLKLFGHNKTAPRPLVRLSEFLRGCGLPLLSVLVFKIFFGGTGEYLGSGRSASESLARVFSEKPEITLIFRSFAAHVMDFASWKNLWLFFFAACITLCFRKDRPGHAWGLPILIGLLNLGYAAAFLISPADLAWHLQTASQRLLIHSAPLALAFTFEALTLRQNIPSK